MHGQIEALAWYTLFAHAQFPPPPLANKKRFMDHEYVGFSALVP